MRLTPGVITPNAMPCLLALVFGDKRFQSLGSDEPSAANRKRSKRAFRNLFVEKAAAQSGHFASVPNTIADTVVFKLHTTKSP